MLFQDIFLGGIDTSSNTIIWAMAELIRNPRVMKEAQDEIRNYLGRKATISEEDIDEFQYLKLIIKETLRLHPVAPLLLPRETISHVKVNGFDVYPKTVVQVNVWSIGRDPKYWKNPEDFYPERFMDNLVDYKGQNFEFIPFGSGRRICPGMFMGLKNIEVVLSNLLFYFDWKLPLEMKDSDINMEEDFGMSLTITKRIPLQLVPVKYF